MDDSTLGNRPLPESAQRIASMDVQELTQKFLTRVAAPTGFDVLFDYLPDVYFFVKDAQGRFVRVNDAFLKLVRKSGEGDVIGARDYDVFPPSLAESYMRDDRVVLETSRAIIDKAELMKNPDGSIDWFCTTKLPLLDGEGNAIGVCGITRDVKKMNASNARFLCWEPVLTTMLNEYATPLQVPDLARRVSLSVSQFNRQFRKRFHTTPRAYLTSVRLNAACHLLLSTDLSMAEVASRTGFYDHSHLTNHFVKALGQPPSKYRLRHASSRAAMAASKVAPRLFSK
ncbi:MAG: AraC family transcriptional regulator [Myxococcales bacterium]|nr:MAG: AraC family transcriptional regulator [Myxococcales bacterium]